MEQLIVELTDIAVVTHPGARTDADGFSDASLSIVDLVAGSSVVALEALTGSSLGGDVCIADVGGWSDSVSLITGARSYKNNIQLSLSFYCI